MQRQEKEKQFSKFLDVFRSLRINIPFAEALEQMPLYTKFMKGLLSKKRKLNYDETVALTEECSAIIQRKLPQKLKDPGSFTIPCEIGGVDVGRALCDLGASINLMPLSLLKKLGVDEVKPTMMSLQLADRSITHPYGIVEDLLVKVGKFIFPADFVVLDIDIKACEKVPIILGRPFLATGRALIDVEQGELMLRMQDDKVIFNVFESFKNPSDSKTCMNIDVVDTPLAHTCEIKDAFVENCVASEISNSSIASMIPQKEFSKVDEKIVEDSKFELEQLPFDCHYISLDGKHTSR